MPKRLMCVVAHPDDECFAFGGALLLAVEAGFETYVICLTDGQAATNRGTSADAKELGQMRRTEYARSCAVLGVMQHEMLSYHDGQLEFEEVSAVARELATRIRTWQPQVVLTFGLDGSFNVHPDHTMTSIFTSAAFHWSARAKRYPELNLQPFAPQRLFHQSTNFTLPDREPLLPAPWTVELDISSVKAKKIEAFHQHTSQAPLLPKVQPYIDKYGDSEYYTLAAASNPQAAFHMQSLVEGLED